MKKILLVCTIALLSIRTYAQEGYASLATKFSETSIYGSARGLSLGGSNIAIGADMSNIAGNPAGLGFYRKNDASVSSALRFSFADANYYNKITSADQANFSIPQLGVVFAWQPQGYNGQEATKDWVGYAFGIGYTRLDNYNGNINYGAKNPTSSITNYMEQRVNQYGAEDLSNSPIEYHAYHDAYWVNYDSAHDYYYGATDGNVEQKVNINTHKAQQSWDFSFGANYANRLYLGANLGFNVLNYTNTTTIAESKIDSSYVNSPNEGLSSATLTQSLNESGASVHLKVGAIVRINDVLRVGVMGQTPDYYGITEYQTERIASTFTNRPAYTSPTAEYPQTDYTINTPGRLGAGFSIFIKKYGFLTGDFEQVYYNKTTFRYSTELQSYSGFADAQSNTNNVLHNNLETANNIRVGAEGNLGSFRIRAGYALYGNPVKGSDFYADARKSITGGIGFRWDEYYLDATVINTSYSSSHQAYSIDIPGLQSPQRSYINNTINTFQVTFGVRF